MINLDSKIRLAIALNLSNLLKGLKRRSATDDRIDRGFTLLEALVAVVVVTILLVGIGPMVALSTAARVNARRVDQATQAGRSYIDAVRGKVFDTSDFPNSLIVDPLIASNNSQGQYTFESIGAPTLAQFPITASTAAPCKLDVGNFSVKNLDGGRVPGVCVDSNGDGFRLDDPQDLVIQPMRSGGKDKSALEDQGFWLAVRVYRADAFDGSVTPLKGTEDTCATSKLVFIGTQGSKACPLVTMRSQIILNLSLTNNKLGTGN
jgi:prepilin-type N-terminal cleavage/methylation domain-containing protein